ncbi:MAG: metallophosphoesterase [Acidobacteriaceae bacterium]|nr:metallophosphoesterase [Acidobacteriaceae bacterium]
MSAAAALMVTGAGFDALSLEPHHALVENVEIRLPHLPDAFRGFRIAQLSDIHFGPFIGEPIVQQAVRTVLALQPDLVVLTGDYVSHPLHTQHGIEGARKAEPLAEVLRELSSIQMVGVLGNHDHWNNGDFVSSALRRNRVEVLENQSLAIERGGERLWIAGVDDVLARKNDIDKTLRGTSAGETVILLAHEPDFADQAANFPVHLQLSGHSHGGQVRIPGVGAPILPPLGTKYPIGLTRVRDLQVYTNRGLGVIAPPVRFNCPPEITLITLMRA